MTRSTGENVVILGAGGMLGRCWTENLQRRPTGGQITPMTSSQCDVSRPEDLEQAIRPGVSVVVNCAAYTDVDGAESDSERADLINGRAVELIANRCRDVGAALVHYSTDYVFPGDAETPYPVDHPRDPVNAYGRSKALGEEALERSGADFLTLRTSWLYAPHGKNFVLTIAGLCATRPTLRVVDDQVGRPTSAAHLVEITRRMLDRGARGVHHACDDGRCSWFEFAVAIAERINPDCRVDPCPSAEFPRPARRPLYSVLDLSRTTELIGPILHWTEALDDVLSRIPTSAGPS